ncbi:protein suppressor of variegation 3-7-like [Musca vetustissima]|uniref:protein suppressor of variegation 3-7-like n=1 Tax=Musca vetustissima TaxID=27455 RepID=UPI002AB79B05|nr:protein suppressor of variegation 3-7-like [Musca vetustissima]
MSFHDDPNDPEWKVTKLKTQPGTVKEHHSGGGSASKPKYSQKFCEKWLNIFSPWLARCEDDPNKPFCRACQCRLDCNRCHLQRHERTSKHNRNLEILINKGEGVARLNLSIRRERSKYYQQRKRLSPTPEDSDNGIDEFIEEPEQENDYTTYEPQTDEQTSEDQYMQDDSMENSEIITADDVQQIVENQSPPPPPPTQPPALQPKPNIIRQRKLIKNEELPLQNIEDISDRKEGMKLLLQIQKDKNELMDSFKELMGNNMTVTPAPKEKNHVDLFFESVSSSVKALSPKMIAEAKMRVSQLICELELRALTENDQQHQQHLGIRFPDMLQDP